MGKMALKKEDEETLKKNVLHSALESVVKVKWERENTDQFSGK